MTSPNKCWPKQMICCFQNAAQGLSARIVTVGVVATVALPVIRWAAGAPGNVKKGTKGKPAVWKVRATITTIIMVFDTSNANDKVY